MFKWFLVAITLAGCAHSRDVQVVRDRMLKLQPLASYTSSVCEIEVLPTQPALARFDKMFPNQVERLQPEAWIFKWRQRESRCEVVPSQSSNSPVVKAQQGFIEASLCVLAQVFFVNSPFDEMPFGPDNVRRQGEWIQLSARSGSEHGLFLGREDFLVISRTPARGEFSAHYSLNRGEWLPDRMEHKPDNLQILVDQIEYGERVGPRRLFSSMMVSVGTERPLPHSQLLVRNCQPL